MARIVIEVSDQHKQLVSVLQQFVEAVAEIDARSSGGKAMGAVLSRRARREEIRWVRFFRVGLDGRKSDHLTSVSRGREGGSGLGTAPPA